MKYIFLIFISLTSLIIYAQIPKSPFNTDRSVKYLQLKEEFQNTPPESRLRCWWWWLNSNTTMETITRDLEEMKAKGYGGATIYDGGVGIDRYAKNTPSGPRFLSKHWLELYRFAVKESDRIGIELTVNLGSGWNPGGPDITPQNAMKKLVYSETEITGGKHVTIELKQPESYLFYKDIIVQAIPMPQKDSPIKNEAIANWSAKSFNSSLGFQEKYPLHLLREGFDNPVAVEIIKKDKKILDLTKYFDGETLNWEAPEGSWLVIRYGYTCNGAQVSTSADTWIGLSVDFLSAEAFKAFSDNVIKPLIEEAKAAGNSLKGITTDSWEMGTPNWTAKFPEEFKQRRGYDLTEYLPVMTGRVVESQEVSNRFLSDMRKTVSDCIADNFFRKMAEIAHENGLFISPESGGPCYSPVNALEMLAINDIPHGEFWAKSTTHVTSDDARLAVKQAATVAHTNGKRYVQAEGPTSIGPQWERAPRDLKEDIDRTLCSGVNRIAWAVFTSSPKEFGLPGNEFFACTHLNPNARWWDEAGDFIGYLNRCFYMLQQGLFVADVLYYNGDDVPNMVFLKEDHPELNFGYDWDACSRSVVLNRVKISNGKIVLPDGMTYRVMVIPDDKYIDLDVLHKLELLVKEGMTLIVDSRPTKATGLSDYPQSDKEVIDITKSLWGDMDGVHRTELEYGRGRVIWGQDINNVLMGMGIEPDLSFTSQQKDTKLDYIHRTMDAQELYLVINRYTYKGIDDSFYRYITSLPDRYEQVDCSFRVSGKVPEFWNPQTGKTTPVLNYMEKNGRTIIPIHFAPEGSVFVVFRDREKQEKYVVKIEKADHSLFPISEEVVIHPPIEIKEQEGKMIADIYQPGSYNLHWSDGTVSTIKVSEESKEVALNTSWIVHFDPKWGGPASITFNELKSWTSFKDDGIKYYSGKATYENSFAVSKSESKGKKLILNLGQVQEMGVVRINGHRLNLLWSPPFEVDITDFAVEGSNKLEIDVVNLWPNRLIGDGKIPYNKRFTKTNIIKFDEPDAERYLREAGLIGPVSLRLFSSIKL